MRIEVILLFLMLIFPTHHLSVVGRGGDAGFSVSIGVETPIPGNRSYRGGNISLALSIYNGLDEPVSISVEPLLDPMILLWSNYTAGSLDPGARIGFIWLMKVPEDIGFGNYTLGFNITYVHGSEINNVYKEAWIEVIPRNITLLAADLYRNATSYYLVISNPLEDPGQYVVENLSITIESFNVSVAPREIFIDELRANSSYTIPLSIGFGESDIGALLVNITAPDDVHGLVFFNYTFIVVNATAYLDLYVVNDYGEPLPGAIVEIANGTYATSPNGSVSLVLPTGIYNYSIVYGEHSVSGRLFLHTGYNTYTVVVDLSPPVIVSAGQRGYSILVKAWDPGPNSTGISRIVLIQGDSVWSFPVGSSRNISLLLYPPLKTGEVVVAVVDGQGNCVNTTVYYAVPERPNAILEFIIVLSIASLLLIALLLLINGLNA